MWRKEWLQFLAALIMTLCSKNLDVFVYFLSQWFPHEEEHRVERSTYYSLSAVLLQPKQSELLTDIICAE